MLGSGVPYFWQQAWGSALDMAAGNSGLRKTPNSPKASIRGSDRSLPGAPHTSKG
jgi:hypothetical protein